MKYNTRFNPTLNGYLHLGHLYNALINMHEARRSGGRFGIRLDDDQRVWIWRCGGKLAEYANQMKIDLIRYGVDYDYFKAQSEQPAHISELIGDLHVNVTPQAFAPNRGAAEVIGIDLPPYPYTEELTAHKVIFDFADEVNWVIRGWDLLTEDCLYRHFCEMYTLPIPRMTYIPRLVFNGDEVSKTKGNCKLKDYPDKDFVLEHLAHDVLKDPDMGWYLENIKHQPVLGKWANAVHP